MSAKKALCKYMKAIMLVQCWCNAKSNKQGNLRKNSMQQLSFDRAYSRPKISFLALSVSGCVPLSTSRNFEILLYHAWLWNLKGYQIEMSGQFFNEKFSFLPCLISQIIGHVHCLMRAGGWVGCIFICSISTDHYTPPSTSTILVQNPGHTCPFRVCS